jgi:hypothetical protein
MANNVRELDELDARIVAALRREGRLPNNALADEVGVAASSPDSMPRSIRPGSADPSRR